MHTGPTFDVMAQLIRQRRYPAEVMKAVAAQDAQRGPYQPCPCGSGKKFRFCHGDKTPASPFTGVAAAATPSQAGHSAFTEH